jgi:hypothetical protein
LITIEQTALQQRLNKRTVLAVEIDCELDVLSRHSFESTVCTILRAKLDEPNPLAKCAFTQESY